jgi:peptidoglycan/LPS O-acetylase OafA/YrhL
MARIVFGRKIGWLTFVGKRLRRIYPAFLVSLVIVTAINCGLFGWPFHWKDFGLNLVFYNAVPGSGIVPYNYVTWSLGLEFAFYLLVPLVGYVARILDARVAATLALVIAYAFVPDSVTRFIGLFVGLLIGSFGDSQLRKLAGVIPVTGVLLCYALLVVVKGYSDPPYLLFYRWLLLLVGFGVICIAFGDNWLSRLLSMPTLRRLGTLSYSFYLFHPVCIALVMRYLLVWLGVKPYPWVALPIYFVASFLLTVAVSYASYNLLEAPYFRAKTKSIESLHVAPVPVS